MIFTSLTYMLISFFMFLFVLFLFLFVFFCFLFCFFLYNFHVHAKSELSVYGFTCGGLDNQGGFSARVFTVYYGLDKRVYHVHDKGGLIIYIINPVQLYSSSFLFSPPLIIYIILIFERHILFSLIFTAVSLKHIQRVLI